MSRLKDHITRNLRDGDLCFTCLCSGIVTPSPDYEYAWGSRRPFRDIYREANDPMHIKLLLYTFKNRSYLIQVVDIDQSYSSVAHGDYLRIKIIITNTHRLIYRIWDVSNDLQNNHFPIIK